MRRFPLALTVALFCLSPLACSDDDDPTGLPTGDPDLAAMVGCVEEGITHLGFAVQTGIALFHELDPGERVAYTPPPDFRYVEDTGEFYNRAVLGGVQTDIDGVVEPLAVVEDGLQQNDVFRLTWWMTPEGSLDNVGAGAFSVNHLGLTSPPDQTEAMRVTMISEIWVDTGATCHTDVTSFGISVRHLENDNEVSAGLVEIRTVSDTHLLTGILTIDAQADTGTISATFKGDTYVCTVDLDTYDVSCSPG